MKQKIIKYLKIGMLLFGITLLFTNCQKDDDFKENSLNSDDEYNLKAITFNEFKEKADSKTLSFIDSSLDFVKDRTTTNFREVTSIDNSFTITTDEIIEVTTDSTATYTFNVINNLSANHNFERFLIQKINQEIKFFIIGFTYDETLDGTDFPYNMEHLPIDNNNINMDEFIDSMSSSYILWVGNCAWEVKPGENDPDPGYLIFIGCAGGGDSSSGDSTSSNGGFTGNNNGGYFGDGSSTGDGTSPGGGGPGGPNAGSQDGSGPSAPFGMSNVPTDKEEVIECIGGSSNLTPTQVDWFNDEENEYTIKVMAHNINQGGCNLFKNIVQNFIDNPTDNFSEFAEQELECYGINNLTTNVYFNQTLSNIQAYSDVHPTEEGYEISMSDDGAVISSNYVHGNEYEVNLATGGNIIGHMHIHTPRGDKMFSGEDIYNLYLLGNNTDNSHYDAFSILHTYNGTYMIKIKDLSSFHQLFTFLGDNKKRKVIRKLKQKLGYKKNANKTTYEKGILNLINDLTEKYNLNKTPLKVFEYNNTTNTFDKLILDSSDEPETEPCN